MFQRFSGLWQVYLLLSLPSFSLPLCVASSPPTSPAFEPAKLQPSDYLPEASLAYFATVDGVSAVQLLEAALADTPWLDALPKWNELTNSKDGSVVGTNYEWLTMLTAPETRAELKKCSGIAAAYLGLNQDSMPRYVVVCLPGESTVLPWFVRAELTRAEAGWQPVKSTPEGVPVYQCFLRDRELLQTSWLREIFKWPQSAFQPTLALVPGLIVLGSDVPAVEEVVRRHKSGNVQGSLGESERTKQRGVQRSAQALFWAAAQPAKIMPDLVKICNAHPKLASLWVPAVLQFLFNADLVSEVTCEFTLSKQAAVLDVRYPLPDSPLGTAWRRIVTGGPIEPAWGEHLPAMGCRGALRLPVKAEEKLETILALADGMARVRGRIGPFPSDAFRLAELPVNADLLDRLVGVGWSIDDLAEPLQTGQLVVFYDRKLKTEPRAQQVVQLLRRAFGEDTPYNLEELPTNHTVRLLGTPTVTIQVDAKQIVLNATTNDSNKNNQPNASPFANPTAGFSAELKLGSLLRRLNAGSQRMLNRPQEARFGPAFGPGKLFQVDHFDKEASDLASLFDLWLPPLELRATKLASAAKTQEVNTQRDVREAVHVELRLAPLGQILNDFFCKPKLVLEQSPRP